MVFSIIAAFALRMFLFAWIAVYGQSDTTTYIEDVVIVPGAGIHGDVLTLPLAYRLDSAIEYYNMNPDVIMVVSGRKGIYDNSGSLGYGARYLMSKRIPEDKIIREDKSTSLIRALPIPRKYWIRILTVTIQRSSS